MRRISGTRSAAPEAVAAAWSRNTGHRGTAPPPAPGFPFPYSFQPAVPVSPTRNSASKVTVGSRPKVAGRSCTALRSPEEDRCNRPLWSVLQAGETVLPDIPVSALIAAAQPQKVVHTKAGRVVSSYRVLHGAANQTLYLARDNLMTELGCSGGKSLSRRSCDDYRSHMPAPRYSVAAIDTKESRTFGVMEINSLSLAPQTVYCGAATPYGNSYSSVILSRLRKTSRGCLFHLTGICVRQ